MDTDKNLWGEGGVTLRPETRYNEMNKQQIGGNFNIVTHDIYNQNENIALMISPNKIHNKTVDAENIEFVNSGFGVHIVAQQQVDLNSNYITLQLV